MVNFLAYCPFNVLSASCILSLNENVHTLSTDKTFLIHVSAVWQRKGWWFKQTRWAFYCAFVVLLIICICNSIFDEPCVREKEHIYWTTLFNSKEWRAPLRRRCPLPTCPSPWGPTSTRCRPNPARVTCRQFRNTPATLSPWGGRRAVWWEESTHPVENPCTSVKGSSSSSWMQI